MALTTDQKKHKEIRYDRQLRLWGDHGQVELERASVCLLNCSATGTELLKSLVLPGVGSFTIIDDSVIREDNSGNNFFLDQSSCGQPRAKVACELLKEMNPEVKGTYILESTEKLISNNIRLLNSFSIVIGTDLTEDEKLQIGDHLWKQKIPFLIARAYGFVGYIRIVVPEHQVVDSHPDSPFPDLRLDHPFPELIEFVNEQKLEEMSHERHSHTPYVAILLRYLNEWIDENGGKFPSTYAEKKLLKAFIESKRMPDEHGRVDEANFSEATQAVNTALHRTEVPQRILSILNDSECLNLHKDSPKFWLMCRALKEFIAHEGNGLLPLRGVLPDMTADSSRYLKLQAIYRNKAEADAQAVFKHLEKILAKLELSSSFISVDAIRIFCRNAAFLEVIRTESIADELNKSSCKLETIQAALDSGNDQMLLYVLMRAVDRFYHEMNRYPGEITGTKRAFSLLLLYFACKWSFIHSFNIVNVEAMNTL